MTEHLAIWNKLSRTDPDQTKAFTRGGGFRGTAIKPVYTELKMTETFGPCGTGWGYTEPTFQIVPCQGGEQAVYCWLSLWYLKEDGQRSELVPGVGGDFIVKSMKGELRADDEAFKKAATDALGNAMKHLGMSADVHMGRFEDNKYVAEMREEARAANSAGKRTMAEIKANKANRLREYEMIPQDLADIHSEAELDRYCNDVLTPAFMSKLGQGNFAVEQWVEDRRKELRGEPHDPETGELPPSKAEFIQNAHNIIEAAKNDTSLLSWWNDAKQKQERRRHELSKEELRDLMARVEARVKELRSNADAIMEAG